MNIFDDERAVMVAFTAEEIGRVLDVPPLVVLWDAELAAHHNRQDLSDVLADWLRKAREEVQ